MKIVFILPGLHMSGGIISTIELSNRLKEMGHDVQIIYPSLLVGPRLKWFNFRSLYTNYRASEQARDTLFDRITPTAPIVKVPTLNERFIPDADAVIATWWETAYYVRDYSKNKGQKFYFVRGYEIWYGTENLIDQTYSFPLKIIVTSTYLKELLKDRLGVIAGEIIPNGINLNLFYKTRPSMETGHLKRVGMVYRGMPWKGMEDGFAAFKLAAKSYPNVKLVLFGSPATGKLPNNVEFHEYPNVNKLRDLYNSLDIFLLPSHPGEAFSNPPLEAMACGTACVLTNVGGIPDYAIPDKTALVSEPYDVASLARNLILLLQNDNKRTAIAEAGYNHIRNFSWDAAASKLAQFVCHNLDNPPV